ncbi:hypothetical protein H4R34_001150 [Dimargaris verticillata]|uniref:Uncharacterized protein n=1 Tax=Dimargaris verticillata TaxID=2761393 RepID=A0A9W8BAE6_9FUNG|nr:hypothetical protein H4R34_001150 [Dimargaris verticillata]
MSRFCPLLDSCFRVIPLRPATIILATLFTVVHLASLFDWSRPHPYMYQSFNLVGLLISGAGLYGAIKYNVLQLRIFGLYLWVGATLSVFGYVFTLLLALLPKGRAKMCHVISHQPGVTFGYEQCLDNFWKAALVVFPVLCALVALKIYMTLVAWSYYRKVANSQGVVDEAERGHYAPLAGQEDV